MNSELRRIRIVWGEKTCVCLCRLEIRIQVSFVTGPTENTFVKLCLSKVLDNHLVGWNIERKFCNRFRKVFQQREELTLLFTNVASLIKLPGWVRTIIYSFWLKSIREKNFHHTVNIPLGMYKRSLFNAKFM